MFINGLKVREFTCGKIWLDKRLFTLTLTIPHTKLIPPGIQVIYVNYAATRGQQLSAHLKNNTSTHTSRDCLSLNLSGSSCLSLVTYLSLISTLIIGLHKYHSSHTCHWFPCLSNHIHWYDSWLAGYKTKISNVQGLCKDFKVGSTTYPKDYNTPDPKVVYFNYSYNRWKNHQRIRSWEICY